jgi:hypothetical protein
MFGKSKLMIGNYLHLLKGLQMVFYAIINSERTVAEIFESKRQAVLDLHYNPLENAQIFDYFLTPRKGSPF